MVRYLGAVGRRVRRLEQYREFLVDYWRFRQMRGRDGRELPLKWEDTWACLGEKDHAHAFDHHYVYHPAWAARILARTLPALHVDISSTLHFSSIISAFIPTRYYEYRAVDLELSDLSCSSADLLALPFDDDTLESLSCMHVVEHIGLGRYGDRLDPDGDLKAIAELKRVLAVGGSLLFVAPVGRGRICFNAHRIYAYQDVIEWFDGLELREFGLIRDVDQGGGLVRSATHEMADNQEYGCGCFWFVKK